MPATTTNRGSARQRLLDAAEELFYEEGVHTVGIDRVIERAGVAKATLYSVFGSKDELVRAYLERHNDAWRERLTGEIGRRYGTATPAEKLLGVFDVLGERSAAPGYHGCAFVNASAEPQELARQLALLYHGAGLSARMDRDLTAAATARAAAATLLAAATS